MNVMQSVASHLWVLSEQVLTLDQMRLTDKFMGFQIVASILGVCSPTSKI